MSKNLQQDTPLGAYRYAFGVITDTHLNEDEDRCSSPFDVNRRANRRMRHVVRSLNKRDLAFVVNVGDLIHPVPALKDRYSQAAANFHAQVKELRHPLYLTPGNHDIGDKPNNWAPAAGICDDFIDLWAEHFGADFHAFDHGGDRFVIINAQIINSGLEQERKQATWLEKELAVSDGRRIFLFSHYPPYFTRPGEVENYDNIGEPGRTWMLDLMAKHKVEALLIGHVHNFWYNLHAGTDCYLLASTSFVRQDYSEMYHARPGADDEAGRNDRAKLGYAVVHVYENGHTIEFVRTYGAELTSGAEADHAPVYAPHRLHPRTNTKTSFGFDMRQNWMELVEIPPTGGLDEFDRKEVRNDYPLMALWEMGIRKLRVPVRDLMLDDNRDRMRMLKRHGHEFTLFSFGAPSALEQELITAHQDIFTAWEIGVNWNVFAEEVADIGTFARKVSLPVYLSRLRSSDELRAEADGRYYHVINQGFLAADEGQMKGILEMPDLKDAISGFVFRVTMDRAPLDAVREADEIAARLGVRASVHIRMCGSNPAEALEDDAWVCRHLAEAVLAATAYPGVAVFADTMIDNDRGYFVRNGVLDRLCNPRPAFHVVRNLIGILNEAEDGISDVEVQDDPSARRIGFKRGTASMTLSISSEANGAVTLEGLIEGTHKELDLVTGKLTARSGTAQD